MSALTNVLIGIQARSTSSRLPRKCFELIGNKPLIQHVIERCEKASEYINKTPFHFPVRARVALLVPEGDELETYGDNRISIVSGPEQDVLSRYGKAAELFKPDYIVRITGDCPLIPPFLITKHVKLALLNSYDYVSNVEETARTAVDGHDCEVFSKAMLEFLLIEAKEASDREHVTTYARRLKPRWARFGNVIGYLDLSHMKLSVDTLEDLERVREEYKKTEDALLQAWKLHGKSSTHRF